MTTATVAAQQRAEHLGRFPVAWNAGSISNSSATATQFTMNDTQQQQQPHQQPPLLHTSDTSPQQQQQQQQQSNANGGSGLSIAANLALLTGSSNGTPPNNITGNNSSNNNNNNSSSSSGNTGGSKSRSVSLNDTKMDHHLREQQQQQHHHHHHQSSQQQQASQHALHSRLRGGVSPTPSEQQYALKWNDFQSSILSSFRHLRDEEDFVDVTIACDTRSFTAHKVVLSACSPYFRKLLKANPCEHPIVILRDVRSDDIENLLRTGGKGIYGSVFCENGGIPPLAGRARFMYNGEVHIGQDQLSDFLKTAQLLQVRGLADVTSGANPTGGRTSANSSMLNSSLSTPAVQELKASPTSTSLPWELPEDNTPAPPPQKRTKSSELYRKQHGLSPDDPIPLDLLPIGQHPLTRDRSKDKSKQQQQQQQQQHDHHHQQQREQQAAQHHLHRGSSEHDLHHHHHLRERDRSLELRESLLGQALEGGPTLTLPSASGEDSNSSDTAASDHGDDIEGLNGNVEHTRPSFPFLQGLQGIPGLIPGPSGMHGDNFDARQHCDTLIKEEIDEAQPRSGEVSPRASPDTRRRTHDPERSHANGLDYSRTGRQQLHQRRLAKRFKRHHYDHPSAQRPATSAAGPVKSSPMHTVDELCDDRNRELQRRATGGLATIDDVREALALRRPLSNHTEVPARQQKSTYEDEVQERGQARGHEQRNAEHERDEDDEDDNMMRMREEEEDEEDEDGAASEENDGDLKVDGRLSAIATTLDSEYHKRMAAAGVLAAAAAASAVSSMNGAAALGDAGSEQAAADFFAAHHKAGTHELAFKQHFLNEKVRLQALLQRQAQQQHQHHQKLAGFLLSTASTPPTPTLTPTSVLNLGPPSGGSDQRGGSQSPAAGGSSCRSSAAATSSGAGGGSVTTGYEGATGASKQTNNSSSNSNNNSSHNNNSNSSNSSSTSKSVAAVAAAAAAADRLFAAAYSNSGTAPTVPSTGGSASSAGGANSGNSAGQGQVYLLPCPLCEVPLEPRVFRQHLDRHYPRDSPVCPVIQCGRRFAHPNSVRNHMRLKHTNQWAQMKAMRSSGGPFTGIP
ncbi:homeobox protein cut-like isoform X2 [Anopheles aquasalis]|uniref:homeobox protein cut-like isoform X2 n=1 Tax=Anopheles aquasalis TaxID=42839 RepID=UPI00215B450D|nr:homeobox protein cut-like isoform X2 [Anopheles aquasalis]